MEMSRLNSSSFLLAEMDGFEPSKWQSQSLLPSLLATSQYLVLKAGLEPARPYEQLILSQSCLPFHHSSMNGCTKPTTSFSLLLVNNGCRSGTWTSRPLGYGPSKLPTAQSCNMAPRTGLEPVTSWLTVTRSTDWAIEEYINIWFYPHRVGNFK